VEKRIKERFGDESDTGWEVYLKCKKLFDPIREEHLVIDNSGTPENIDKQINEYF